MRFFQFLFLCGLVTNGLAVIAQDRSKYPVQVIGPAHCQDYGAVLAVVVQNAQADLPIIVIARLGKGDTRSELNRRRLHNVRTYWIEFRSEKRPFESVIIAEGERVKDYGRLEVYVGGKLTALLKLKGNSDLIVGNCYPEPMEAPFCDLKENRDFYPCLDRNGRRKKG